MLLLGCTTVPLEAGAPAGHRAAAPAPVAESSVRRALSVRVAPEPATVEDHWLLRVYERLRPGSARSFRLDFRGSDGEAGVAHWLLPSGPGPHPTVLVFPILGGSHVVSEALAKALARRGYAVVRLERRRLFQDDDAAGDFAVPARRLRATLHDARGLIDWIGTRPELDAERLGVAGVSIGGIVAATLMGIDPRVRAGFFVMAGGGLAELLYDSSEGALRRFRSRHFAAGGARDREAFLREARRHTRDLDPLANAHRIDPRQVVLISGRFDRVVPPARTEALWKALGRPTWHRFPAGHYEIVPFFWWAVGRGADGLDRALAAPGVPDALRASAGGG